MKVTFWGVRGSIPCPGPQTVKYGGNTISLECRFEGIDRIFIIDAGSGIRSLGDHLLGEHRGQKPLHLDLFITHTHWDHIQGLPFFGPMYIPETRIRIYGPATFEEACLEKILGAQWAYRYFPKRQQELAAHIEYVNLKEGRFDLGDGIVLKTKYLNHSLLCLGYRLEYADRVVCTAYDTEPFQNVFCTDPADPFYDETMAAEGMEAAAEENGRMVDFFCEADLLIHDAQYTQKEYDEARVGWGHSPIEHAVAEATRARVKRLALFHHDPKRTDGQMDEFGDLYCTPPHAGPVHVFVAREGMQITV